jgi:uncharacterized membrane protein
MVDPGPDLIKTFRRLMRTNFRLASSWLALLGFLVSGYLALFELGVSQEIFCPIGACEEVNASPYVYMLGVPLALVGVAVYLLVLALNLVGLWWGKKRIGEIALLLFLFSLLGVAFSAYLTYLELFVLEAICSWCVVSAITMTAIFILSGWELIRALRFPSKV